MEELSLLKKKRKRSTAASLGNKKMGLNGRISSRSSDDDGSGVEPRQMCMDMTMAIKLLGEIEKKCTCSKGPGDNSGGCLLKANNNDPGEMVKDIHLCRSRFQNLNEKEILSKKWEILRSVLPPPDKLFAGDSNGQEEEGKKIICNWNIRGNKVCKNTFLILYDITDYEKRRFIKSVRRNGSSVDVCPMSIREWSDSTIQKYSMNELDEVVFRDNIFDSEIGA